MDKVTGVLQTPAAHLWSPSFPHAEFQEAIKVKKDDPDQFVEWEYRSEPK